MAVPPQFAAHKLDFYSPPSAEAAPAAPADLSSSSSGLARAPHTLEFYLDYCCPYSAKIFRSLVKSIIPMIKANPKWADSMVIIFRQQVQPWHPSSTLLHESALAVMRIAPEKFWDYSALLFEEQQSFFDVNVVNETRNDTYRRLAKIATRVGVGEEEVYGLLQISDKPAEDGSLNTGNGVTNDLKLVTKMNRLIGIHVTPTAVYDGVVQDVSSGGNRQEWNEWLEKNVT